MLTILSLTIPFFAVIALGAIAVWTRMLDGNAARTINVFVFNFTMPALVISGLAKQDFNALIDIPFLAGWMVAGLLIFGLGMIFSKLFFDGSMKEMAVTGQAASIGNLGFLGFPLLAITFGDEGLRVAATALVIDLVVIIPLCLAILEGSGKGDFWPTVKRIFKGVLINPFIFGISVGVFLSATGIGLPGAVGQFVEFVAGAAGPSALFTLGVSLASRRFEGDVSSMIVIMVFKLIAHPLAVFVALTLFGVSGQALAIGVVLAALPVAGNVFIVAQQYDTMVRRVSSVILVSTVAAIATTAYVLNWAGVGN